MAALIAAFFLAGISQADDITVSGFTEETSRAADAPFMLPALPGPVMHGNFPPRPTPGFGTSPTQISPMPLTAGGGTIVPDFGLGTTMDDLDFNNLGSSGELTPLAPVDILSGDTVIHADGVSGTVPGPGVLPLIGLGGLLMRNRRRRT